MVFGHSYGGNVALALAERHPQLVRAVAVYEVPLSWLPWWPGSTGRRGTAVRGTPEDAAEQFMRRMVGDDQWDALSESTRAARRSEGVAFVEEITDLGAAAPWHAERIDVPVVAMYGSLTREHHRDGCHYLAELLSDRDAIAIEGARHNGPYTHPDAVAAVIRDLEAARLRSGDRDRRGRCLVGTEQRGAAGHGDLLAEERARRVRHGEGVDRVTDLVGAGGQLRPL